MAMGDEEQNKQKTPESDFSHHQLQLDSDFALAMALQEQEQEQEEMERDFHFPTTESISDIEEDYDEDDDDDIHDEDYDYDAFFQSQESAEQAESQHLEEEESNDDQLMEEDDIDPDELSYEELMALGETVGEENKGLSLEQISLYLRPYTSSPITHTKTCIDRCVICQVEYGGGETLVALPCDVHPYHSDCITKWLQIKKVCPICGIEVSSPSPNIRNSV